MSSKLFFHFLFFYSFRINSVYANSSFDDLVSEVAEEVEISRSLSSKVVRATFITITKRMMEDKGTSIPDFGRFYAQEKQKSTGKDKDGYTLEPKMVRSPRFTISKELKNILEE
jgi:nucleoid DNA-binding protein